MQKNQQSRLKSKLSPSKTQSKVSSEGNEKEMRDPQKRSSQCDQYDGQISVLPLQSVKISKSKERRKKLKSQVKYINIAKDSTEPSPPHQSRIKIIKNVVFRNRAQRYISQEKARRQALGETRIFERQRRFIKQQVEKKNQRLVKNLPPTSQNAKRLKFQRSEEKKLLEEHKKFRRIKEKMNEEQLRDQRQNEKIMALRMMMKTHSQPHLQMLSNIGETNEQYLSSNMSHEQSSKNVPCINQTYSVLQDSQILFEEREHCRIQP